MEPPRASIDTCGEEVVLRMDAWRDSPDGLLSAVEEGMYASVVENAEVNSVDIGISGSRRKPVTDIRANISTLYDVNIRGHRQKLRLT